jgi:hypothetical protein
MLSTAPCLSCCNTLFEGGGYISVVEWTAITFRKWNVSVGMRARLHSPRVQPLPTFTIKFLEFPVAVWILFRWFPSEQPCARWNSCRWQLRRIRGWLELWRRLRTTLRDNRWRRCWCCRRAWRLRAAGSRWLWIESTRRVITELSTHVLLIFETFALGAAALIRRVMVQREMEKPGSGDKVECTSEQIKSICRIPANPEGERQGGIVPPPFGLGPWVGARVVSPRSPIPAQAIIDHSATERLRQRLDGDQTAGRLASRAAFLRWRAASSLRSRSARIAWSRPASLSAGAT